MFIKDRVIITIEPHGDRQGFGYNAIYDNRRYEGGHRDSLRDVLGRCGNILHELAERIQEADEAAMRPHHFEGRLGGVCERCGNLERDQIHCVQ